MYENMIKAANEIVEEQIEDEKVRVMFKNCYGDMLKNTIRELEDGSTFVLTGDIPAMWLRDSACQLRPFIVFAGQFTDLDALIERIIHKQMSLILKDPYANAFNTEANGKRWDDDIPLQKPEIWEQKYEIDSLCFPFQLAYQYWKYTGRTEIFDDTLKKAMETVISVWRTEQDHERNSHYRFQRPGTDDLPNNGLGSKTAYTGMTWSGFRPSDDACKYHYLVPSNLFAVRILEIMKEIAETIYDDFSLASDAELLAKEIAIGIEKYGIITTNDGSKIYAYEVDGLGNQNLMDDSNMPSLLSLPMLTTISNDDEIYQNTREFILSASNPYFYEGRCARGIGSPHTPYQHVWPIALAVEGLTSSCETTKWEKIKYISENDAGTNQVHESFHVDKPEVYTREWFSWANSMFCELVLDYCGYKLKYK